MLPALPVLFLTFKRGKIVKDKDIIYIYFYTMLFWPLLSYLTLGVLGLRTIHFYYYFITIVLGVFFLFSYVKTIRIPLYAFFAFLFFLYVMVRNIVFFEGDITSALISVTHLRNLSIFFLLLIIYYTDFRSSFINHSVAIIKITILVSFIISVLQVFDTSILNAWALWRPEGRGIIEEGLYLFRRSSIFGFIDPNALGLSFIPLWSVLIGHLLKNRSKYLVVFIIAGAIVALLSNTRYVMAGIAIIPLQLLIAHKFNINSIIRYVVVILMLLFVMWNILAFFGFDTFLWYQERLFREGSIEATTRYKAIDNFLFFFPQFPIFGNGSISDEAVIAASRAIGSSHIHVGYLSHLVAYGIVGCFFLFGFWFMLIIRLYRNAKKTDYWGSFFAYLFFLFSFATMSQPSIFYYGLIFALIFDKYYIDLYYEQYEVNLIEDRNQESISKQTG